MSAHRERAADVPATGPFPLAGLSTVDRLAVRVATAGGVGYAAKAPGTWGSLPGLALGAALQALLGDEPWLIGTLLGAATLSACWAIARTERALRVHDDGRIVVDEVVGQAIAVAFLPLGLVSALLGFALFRLLDIKKPLAIGWIDAHAPGAVGTLGDDVLAGVVAAGVLVGVHVVLPW